MPAMIGTGLEPRRQDEREQLGLVADFRERDDPGRDEEGFQFWLRAGTKPMTTQLPGHCGGNVVKGLAKLEAACAMT